MREEVYSKRSVIITVLFFLATIIIPYYLVPAETVNRVMEEFMRQLGPVFEDDFTINVFFLFFNNLRASFIMLIIGWVPLLFLPYLTLGLNGIIIGIALKLPQISGTSTFIMIIFGLLPHGIFEIPALLISFLLGVFICKNISRGIIGRKQYNFKEVFIFTIKEYIFKVIPLLAVAAVIETYITPLLLFKFM